MSSDRNVPAAATGASSDLAAALARGLAALPLAVPAEGQAALLGYVALMHKWNKVYNLTAVHEPRAMLVRHLLDSLTLVPHLQGPRVLDVGTGPGLPGIPLAIALPALEFVLLDRTAKKTRFVTQAVGELKLTNVRVETARIEDYHPSDMFDTVVTRAFSGLAEFTVCAGRLLRPGGLLLAMKGRHPADEIAALPPGYRAERCLRLAVPGLDEERHVVYLRRVAAGPD